MSSLPHRRTVADVMTARVHVAGPLTPFKLLVRLIEENRVSAIPIVDVNGVPVGIVSESDLLHMRRRQRERAKADGVVASDLMTTPPITVASTTTLTGAAKMMQVRNVRRLIVVDERGRIAGVVSRSDLLQVFLRTDEELRDEIVDRLIPALMLSGEEPVGVEVEVLYNVVTLTGEVDRKSDADILARMTRELDGVVEVVSQLTYRWDDSRPVREFAPPALQTAESI
jgi:CBS domain-containing protein